MTQPQPPNEHAFVALYEREYGDVLRFVQRRAHPDHAEDVAAEAFLVAWRRLADLPRGEEAGRAWVFGIARNVLLNQRRGQQRQQALGIRLADHAAVQQQSTEDPAQATLRTDLQRVWTRLSAVHQEALSLAIFEDLDSVAAAEVLGVSAVAYRLRLSRARRALRLHLQLHSGQADRVVGATERTVIS